MTHFFVFMQALGLPIYWKFPFFNFAGGDHSGHVSMQAVLDAYKRYCTIRNVVA